MESSSLSQNQKTKDRHQYIAIYPSDVILDRRENTQARNDTDHHDDDSLPIRPITEDLIKTSTPMTVQYNEMINNYKKLHNNVPEEIKRSCTMCMSQNVVDIVYRKNAEARFLERSTDDLQLITNELAIEFTFKRLMEDDSHELKRVLQHSPNIISCSLKSHRNTQINLRGVFSSERKHGSRIYPPSLDNDRTPLSSEIDAVSAISHKRRKIKHKETEMMSSNRFNNNPFQSLRRTL